MADVKIADLLLATTVADTDLFIVEDNADTKKITKTNLINAIGGIVESGSNTNGRYVKFADGTMVQYHYFTGVVNGTSGWNVVTETILWTFPVPFSNSNFYVNVVSVNETYNTGGDSSLLINDKAIARQINTTNSTGVYITHRTTVFGNRVAYIRTYAIGRWK